MTGEEQDDKIDSVPLAPGEVKVPFGPLSSKQKVSVSHKEDLIEE